MCIPAAETGKPLFGISLLWLLNSFAFNSFFRKMIPDECVDHIYIYRERQISVSQDINIVIFPSLTWQMFGSHSINVRTCTYHFLDYRKVKANAGRGRQLTPGADNW